MKFATSYDANLYMYMNIYIYLEGRIVLFMHAQNMLKYSLQTRSFKNIKRAGHYLVLHKMSRV